METPKGDDGFDLGEEVTHATEGADAANDVADVDVTKETSNAAKSLKNKR